jgi:hypothetical protein
MRFDRRLAEAVGDATGIGPYTFVVQYGNSQQDLEFLPSDPNLPPSLEIVCVAVFTIVPNLIDPRRRNNINNSVIFVTLECDFLLDCHDNPVDGNHLGGELPSGDGVAGGVFKSWFRVVPDEPPAPPQEAAK